MDASSSSTTLRTPRDAIARSARADPRTSRSQSSTTATDGARTDAARHSLASIAPRSRDRRTRRRLSLQRVPALAAARHEPTSAFTSRCIGCRKDRRRRGCRGWPSARHSRAAAAVPVGDATSGSARGLASRICSPVRGGESAPSGTLAAVALRPACGSRDRRRTAERRHAHRHPLAAARRAAANRRRAARRADIRADRGVAAMRLAIEGSLLSHDFLRHGLAGDRGGDDGIACSRAGSRWTACMPQRRSDQPPARRWCFRRAAAPLARMAWLESARRRADAHIGRPVVGAGPVGWSRDRDARDALGTRSRDRHPRGQPACARARPAICASPPTAACCDWWTPRGHRSRGALDFDLDRCQIEGAALTALYLLAGAGDRTRRRTTRRSSCWSTPSTRRIAPACRSASRYATAFATRSFRSREAIDAAPRRARGIASRSRGATTKRLTAVYRILFLLFAEARRLVPIWHPVYRDGYTLAALAVAARGPRERARHLGGASGDRPARAHGLRGRRSPRRAVQRPPVRAGPRAAARSSPARRSSRERRARLARVRRRQGRDGRRRVAYEDLGVEQLGSIYEHLLDDEPAAVAPEAPSRRKVTGSFYTPAPLTDYLVRVTLDPLVRGKTVDEILSLRIRRSGDGQRRVPRGGVPLPRAGVRARASRGGRARVRRRHARGVAAAGGAAMPVRRGCEPDGRAARAAVAVARDAGRRAAAVVSRSPSAAAATA